MADSRFLTSSPILPPTLKFPVKKGKKHLIKNAKKDKVAKLFPNKISRDKIAYSKQDKKVLRQSKIQRKLKRNILTLQTFPICYRDQVINDTL